MNTIVVDKIHRHFQLWAYSVSMARLLLRRTKSETFNTRYDILFQNVKALKLPTSFNGIIVEIAKPLEAEQILAEAGMLSFKKVFTIRSGILNCYVIAGACVTAEDAGEFFEPSCLWPEL